MTANTGNVGICGLGEACVPLGQVFYEWATEMTQQNKKKTHTKIFLGCGHPCMHFSLDNKRP